MAMIAHLRERTAPGQAVQNFLREESGMVTPLVLIFIFLMMVTGGIAVDLMRFEWRRVQVQNTLDRATLSVANLTQVIARSDLYPTEQAHAEALVQDYFTKAGLPDNLTSVVLDEGLNYRIVKARADVISANFFMSLLNIPQLAAINASTAEQRTTHIEIALVLDVSGSMYNNISRITNLKLAAKDFIDAVLSEANRDLISVSIVPYNGQVNLGPDLFAAYNVTNKHGAANSYCIDLPLNTYSTTTISRQLAMPQVPFADAYSSTTQSYNSTAMTGHTTDGRNLRSNIWCTDTPGNYVRVHNNNPVQLKAQIDGLLPIGATAINLGMKWGTALLDPDSQPVVASLAGRGIVPAVFAARPAPYSDRETTKIIVLMTDGEHFEQERFNDTQYRTGDSPIYYAASDKKMSIFHQSRISNSSTRCKPFWVPHYRSGSSGTSGEWHARPWTGTAPDSALCFSTSSTASLTGYTAPNGAARQSWQQVWAIARVQWVAWELYARAISGIANTTAAQQARVATYKTWMDNFRSLTDTITMDSQLESLCTRAKETGIEVYGIAFESTTRGENLLRNCSSTPKSKYFFNVSADGKGVDIRTAFRSIASTLSKLRLTQ